MAPKVALLLMLGCLVVAAPYTEALTCGQLVSSLNSCFTYLRSGGAVPPSCCSAVKSVNSATNATPARQAACVCLIKVVRSGGFKSNLVSGLPGKCGVNIGYPISPSMDCSKYA